MTDSAPDLPIVLLLSETIERYPEEPVNYLLRGEAWLTAGDPRRAASDFEAARDLVRQRLAQSAWGYVEQAYLDRAQAGLTACEGELLPTDSS